jgi:hypothetical protein
MKTVFKTNQELVECFFLQKQAVGTTSRASMSFSGDTIYSYKTPIARITTFMGEPILLVTRKKYSNTTSKQLRVVKFASRYLNIKNSDDFITPCLYDDDIIYRIKKLKRTRVRKVLYKEILENLLFTAKGCNLVTESKFPLFFDKKHDRLKRMLFSNDEETISLAIKLAKKQELI